MGLGAVEHDGVPAFLVNVYSISPEKRVRRRDIKDGCHMPTQDDVSAVKKSCTRLSVARIGVSNS